MRESIDDIMSPNTAASDAAAFWLMRRDLGVALEHDPDFKSWLAASSSNVTAWEKAVALWDGVRKSADPLLDAMRKDALSARRPSAGQSVRWALMAAGLVIAVAGIAIYLNITGLRPPSDGTSQLIALNAKPTFIADASGPATFALADGSSVTLAANSALAVQYGKKSRAVRLLHGRAFFSVIHNSARPFTADVAASTIVDQGTDFDVQLTDFGLSVILINGSLDVAVAGGEVTALKPGQRLEAMAGQNVRVTAVDVDGATAWRTGYLEFSDEPLGNAIRQINRYGGPPARIVDSSVDDIRVSGRFRAGDPSRFGRALAEIYPLRVQDRTDGGVDIRRR